MYGIELMYLLDTKRSAPPASAGSSKRVKVDEVATTNEDSPVTPATEPPSREKDEEPVSAVDLPPLSQTDESDSDDDDEVMAGLIAASQALQRMPAEGSKAYDISIGNKQGEAALQKYSSNTESDTQPEEDEDEEEPPPDPYGMPPLSQWKRSSRR